MAILGQKGLPRHNSGGLPRKKQQNQAGREKSGGAPGEAQSGF
jgi:hypothetical protein